MLKRVVGSNLLPARKSALTKVNHVPLPLAILNAAGPVEQTCVNLSPFLIVEKRKGLVVCCLQAPATEGAASSALASQMASPLNPGGCSVC